MTAPSPASRLTGSPAPGRTDPGIIRNFSIIAHIDHGKSTLADRMLQLTGVVDASIDAGPVPGSHGYRARTRDHHQVAGGPDAVDQRGRRDVLNMIDTPGHVDFTYEVSRSLAACEGAVLLVDAAQGIEAQTLANLYLALDADLVIIPVLNKIDLPSAQPDKYASELASIIGCDPGDVLRVSAKTGEGVPELLDEIVRQVPAAGRPSRRPGAGVDLRLRLRHLPWRDHLRAGDRRGAVASGAGIDDVDEGHPRDARGRGDLAGADEGRLPRRR